jgi:Ca2+-binding EF-hand superfamily protein
MLGVLFIALSVYQAQTQPQPVQVIAWYDMNGDGVINYKDFDLNNDGAVTTTDVQMVMQIADAKGYAARYDFNKDGKVDQTDVDIIKNWVGKGRQALYDMNGDGIVDWHDLDINNDGKVDIRDIVLVANAYGSKIGDAKYNPRCDFNQDGVIDDNDVNLIKPFFGYPHSIIDISFLNPISPLGQLFIAGVLMALIGLVMMVR